MVAVVDNVNLLLFCSWFGSAKFYFWIILLQFRLMQGQPLGGLQDTIF